MKTLHIGILLHFHQPWWQFPNVLKSIVEESYRPLLTLFPALPRMKLTFNISGSLIELLKKHNYPEILRMIDNLINIRSQAELTGTLFHHGLAPYLSSAQLQYQEGRQMEILHQEFGIIPQGIFLPEMAYKDTIIPHLLRYKWLIIDDCPVSAHGIYPLYDRIYTLQNTVYFLRSSLWSNRVSFDHVRGDILLKEMVQGFKQWASDTEHAYVILAMDAETFNHWNHGYAAQFFPSLHKESERTVGGVKVEFNTLSELLQFPKEPAIFFPPCTWSTSYNQSRSGLHFPLWDDPANHGHHLLWELYRLAETIESKDPELLEEVARFTTSCHWWQTAMGKPHLALPGIDILITTIKRFGGDFHKALQLREEFLGYYHLENCIEKDDKLLWSPASL